MILSLFQRPLAPIAVACVLSLLASHTDCAAQVGGVYPPAPDGYKLIEGDIIVPVAQSGPHGTKGVYRPYYPFYWPDGVVPYEFDAAVAPTNRIVVLDALAEWEAVASVHFVPRNGQGDYLCFQNSTENSSMVGKMGGRQVVNIFNWWKFIIVHELGHALGLWHEQSRPDRNSYIQINLANIEPGLEDNFQVYSEARYYAPYDFDSIMHYNACAFSVCASCDTNTPTCWTIVVQPPYAAQWQNRIGQRDHLSHWDQTIMSFLYPQPDWVFVQKDFPGTLGGSFLFPFADFATGETNVPSGGTLWVLTPGIYTATGTHSKPMTIQAPLGGVVLQ